MVARRAAPAAEAGSASRHAARDGRAAVAVLQCGLEGRGHNAVAENCRCHCQWKRRPRDAVRPAGIQIPEPKPATESPQRGLNVSEPQAFDLRIVESAAGGATSPTVP